jgi:hypothetical protein
MSNYNSPAKLPIGQILGSAIRFPENHHKDLIKYGLAFLLVSIGLVLIPHFGTFAVVGQEIIISENTKIALGIGGLLGLITVTQAMVAFHRIALTSDRLPPLKPWRWGSHEWNFLKIFATMAIALLILSFPFSMILNIVIQKFPQLFMDPVLGMAVYMLMLLPIFYVLTRISLALPAIAVEDPEGSRLDYIWNLSAGNGGRLLFLVFFVPFTTNILSVLLPQTSLWSKIVNQLIMLVVFVFEIRILSFCYAFLKTDWDSEPTSEPDYEEESREDQF